MATTMLEDTTTIITAVSTLLRPALDRIRRFLTHHLRCSIRSANLDSIVMSQVVEIRAMEVMDNSNKEEAMVSHNRIMVNRNPAMEDSKAATADSRAIPTPIHKEQATSQAIVMDINSMDNMVSTIREAKVVVDTPETKEGMGDIRNTCYTMENGEGRRLIVDGQFQQTDFSIINAETKGGGVRSNIVCATVILDVQ